ncbi:DUF2442 domain-containing protein [Burkholderia sp. AU28942]|uniref:DUF2442 domain-containing protein n=1 Tax=Burkholderia TaxID=32008 RepID=UPI0008422162|nr:MULTISPECIES: DUF2442 domain-containing protein [Burkholderia]AOK06001.1 hypothetical protein WK25_15640 [Burkholderia latens]MCA8312594.1 DUF2442 domain-containing protein [Burkholderia sp. AU28942]QTO52635.1 hypothetical protein J8I86_29465 [Burkholderia latens]
MPVKISLHDYDRALERGRQALARPHVIGARYLPSDRVMELQYSSGWVLRFNPRETEWLRDVPEKALAFPYVTPGGDGLIFDDAEVSVSIPGLVAQLVPLDIARSVVASARGRVTSAAKAEAARLNGLKGGRPPKATL